MKLEREALATEALREDVDLQRLFVEMVEAIAASLHGQTMGDLRIMNTRGIEMLQRIRELGFEGLSCGKWQRVVGLRHRPDRSLLEEIESMIDIHGRTCRIDDVKELRAVIEGFRTLSPGSPSDMIIHCLAETAVNQLLDRKGIGRIESNPVHNPVDANLATEGRAIMHLVHDKMVELLTEPHS